MSVCVCVCVCKGIQTYKNADMHCYTYNRHVTYASRHGTPVPVLALTLLCSSVERWLAP